MTKVYYKDADWTVALLAHEHEDAHLFEEDDFEQTAALYYRDEMVSVDGEDAEEADYPEPPKAVREAYEKALEEAS